MSEFGDAQRLILSGSLATLLVLSHGFGACDASAGSLYRSASPLALTGAVLAQAAEQQAQPAAEEVPAEPGEVADDVPFSELNEALTAARSRLAELTKAAEIAKVAGEIREKLQTVEAENRQLKSVLSQLQTDNGELHAARQAAERQVQELERAAEEAAAETRRLDEELVALRSQNRELGTSLARSETAASETAGELLKVREEMNARVEGLTAAADKSAGEITSLQRELDEARERTLNAERQQAENTAELVELRQVSEEVGAERGRLARDLDATITELATARSELSTTRQALEDAEIARRTVEEEAGVLRTQLAGNRTEAEQLRGRLESAQADLDRVRTLNTGLEQQVDVLKAAAGEATDAARQNLLAVEDRIDEINAALALVKAEDLVPGAGGPVVDDDGGSVPARAAEAAGDDAWVPRPPPPRAEVQEERIAAAASDDAEVPVARSPLGGAVSPPPAPQERGAAPGVNLVSLTTDLPPDRQQDAAALLGELDAEQGPLGLSMTVPGELLFAVNSERIEPAAFEALASVAKLVDLYEERDVLIVGHTDAVGDAGYNQQLSERRAELVKKFFVENFEISEERLRIEGKGEQDPITSNATADGRNTNRRVEVVILE